MMRKLVLSVMMVLAVIFISLVRIPTSYCSGGFYRFTWFSEGSQLFINVDYPSEAHLGDIITCVLSGSWFTNRLVNEFDVYLNYFRDDGTWQTLYSTNLFTNVPVTANTPLNFTFQVEVPIHTIVNLPYNMQLGISIRTNGSSMMDTLEIYTTSIVDKTHSELETENSQLATNYSLLNQSYEDYMQSHTYTNSSYESLNSSYTQYMQSHSYTNTDHNNMQSELNQTTNVNYLLSASVVILVLALIGSIAFFTMRKPKIKPT